MAIAQYMIGTTQAGMANLENLASPVHPPKSAFIPYTSPFNLADGNIRGGGWATATWTWNIIQQAERDSLRVFCPGASANVYIHTRCNDSSDSYKTYQAVMIWPQEEAKDARRRVPFTIQFRALVEVV